MAEKTVAQAVRYKSFLSHNSEDKPLVRELALRLKDEGIECWLDEWHLTPGEPWQWEIEEALDKCDTCTVFVGPSGLGDWQHEEMRWAIGKRVSNRESRFRVIPVLLPGANRPQRSHLPGFLVATTWVDFRESLDDEIAFRRLRCGILGLKLDPVYGSAIREGECPYRGLKPFHEEHAPLFFGREARVEWLVERLKKGLGTNDETRFLAIIGASGSGKSSLARAGLIPAIRRGEVNGFAEPVVVCRPGHDPLENLAVALKAEPSLRGAIDDVGDFIDRLAAKSNRLHLMTKEALHGQDENRRAVILVDQFEEVFTLCNDEQRRRAFIDNLLYATNVTGGKTLVILTMRADFYGKCATYERLATMVSDSQELVPPMAADELRRAIESPAQRSGCELEPGLTELLLQDMRHQSGALPLLQHALLQLWERRSGRRLTIKDYQEIGELEGALEQHANSVFESMDAAKQEACRRILLRLTQPGEGGEDTKRRVPITQLGENEIVRSVTSLLAETRLITTETEGGHEESYVEVSHEALIRGWNRLGQWIEEDRDSLRVQHRLSQATQEWLEKDEDESFLYSGARLAQAEEWAKLHPSDVTTSEDRFLQACIEVRDRQKRKEEQQRELEQELFRRMEQAKKRAVVTVDDYFTAVSNREELKAQGLQGLRKELLEKAKDFYIGIANDQSDDPKLVAEQGRAYLRLGIVSDEAGEKHAATEHFIHARDTFTKLLQMDGNCDDVKMELAESMFHLGRVTSSNEKALSHLSEAIRQLESRSLRDDEGKLLQVRILNALGLKSRSLTNSETVLEHFASADRLCSEMLESNRQSERPDILVLQAAIKNNRADVFKAEEKSPDAASEYAKARQIFSELIKSDGDVIAYKAYYATSLRNSAGVASSIEEKLSCCEEAIAILRRISSIERYRVDLATSYYRLGEAYRLDEANQKKKSQLEEAKKSFEYAASILGEFAVKDEEKRLLLQLSNYKIALVNESLGQKENAVASYEESANILTESANILTEQKKTDEANEKIKYAMKRLEAALKIANEHSRHRLRLRHGLVQACRGDWENAIEEANVVISEASGYGAGQDRATIDYLAARVYSHAYCLTTAKEYSIRAIELLKSALDQEFFDHEDNAVLLTQDFSLVPLHEIYEYRTLTDLVYGAVETTLSPWKNDA